MHRPRLNAERRTSTVFVLLLVLLPSSFALARAEQEKITLGVSVPLTGAAATYGTDVKNVLLFANSFLAKGKYRLQVEDDHCDSKEAAAIAHKFANIDKVKYVLGLPCSNTMLASAPIYEAAKVLVIGSYAAAPHISLSGDYIFRTRPSSAEGAALLAQHVSEQHKTFAILAEQTEYGQDMKQAFIQRLPPDTDIVVEDFLSSLPDYRTLIFRIKAKAVSGLVILSQTEQTLAALVRQVREANWPVQLYGAYHPGSSTFLALAGKEAEGLIFVTLPSARSILNEEGKSVFDNYLKTFGPMNSNDYTFFTAFASFAALHQALQSGEDVKAYLYRAKFPCLFGEFSFDQNGDIAGIRHVLKRISQGKAEVIEQ